MQSAINEDKQLAVIQIEADCLTEIFEKETAKDSTTTLSVISGDRVQSRVTD